MKPLGLFVSSVINQSIENLSPERQAIEEFALQLQPLIRPYLFEAAPASSKRLTDSYLDEVRGCSIFCIIVGKAISDPVIEEYQLATELGKPRIVFVKDVEDRTAEAQSFLEQIRNDRHYKKFKDASDLSTHAREAILAEIARLIDDCGGASSSIQARLRSLTDEGRELLCRQMIPSIPSPKFIPRKIEKGVLHLQRAGTGLTVQIPMVMVKRVIPSATSTPAIIELEGRLQWITSKQEWIALPEPPPNDPSGIGYSKTIVANKAWMDEFATRMAAIGLQPSLPLATGVGASLGPGQEVYFDDDGYSLLWGEHVVVVKPIVSA